MNMRWNLDNLYTSFESDTFKKDYEGLDSEIDVINQWADKELNNNEKALEKILWWIASQNSFGHKYQRLSAYARLTFSVDASNNKAKKYDELLEVKVNELTKANVLFIKWISSLDNLEDLINQSEILQKHKFYLSELVKRNTHLLGDDVEMVLSKMKVTGSSAWSQLWNVLTSNLLVPIEINGKKETLPLPVIRNMANHKDSKVRKIAFEAELKAYETFNESAAASINGIKGEVITECRLRNYNSPLDMTLAKSKMDRETLEAMLEAMKDSFPQFRKYYKRKAELLGHKNGLPFYDIVAPMGKTDMKFTLEEARVFVVKNFRKFSNELADFANSAFENEWIDSEPREGKRGGAFCSNLHSIGESRIMSNFTGSFSDVTTMAHELGHAYHGHCLKQGSYINSSYPMPLAETASIFCETIVVNAVLNDTDKEGKFTILEGSISHAAQVIVDIYSRFLFESELFEKRENGSLSVEELKQAMINGQMGSYGDGLDKDHLHPYMWMCKPHYYYGSLNFYNFPYAFGLLFAKGLYAEYVKKGDSFIGKYNNLLSSTGMGNIADVVKNMGIDVRSKAFWKSSLAIVEKDINKFLELS